MKNAVVCLTFAALLAFPLLVSAQNKEVVSNDFEKGARKWERRGQGVAIKISKTVAANGQKSLRVSGRREKWQGAQLNLTNKLKRGRWHLFSVSVKLDGSETKERLKMSMQRGDNRWDNIAESDVGSGDWVRLTGRFKPDGSSPYLLVYLESENPRVSFFMDDFKIEEIPVKKQEGVLIKSDFQDQTAQNWLIMGPGVKMFAAAIGGNTYLKVSGRTENWHGLARDLTPDIVKGTEYGLKISVKIPEGAKTDSIRMMMRQTRNGKSGLVEVSKVKVTGGAEWVTLSGTYRAKKEFSDYLLVVQAESADGEFSIDNFELSVLKK